MIMQARMSNLLVGGAAELKVQDVFDVDTWTGNGSSRTIVTPFQPDMVWIKDRSAARFHFLFDTTRGAGKALQSSATAGELTLANSLTGFSAGGYSLGDYSAVNTNGEAYVGWCFKRSPKFFDVVAYTGNGSARTLDHSLGATPGLIIIKRLDAVENWPVFHRSSSGDLFLNLNSAAIAAPTRIQNPTATTFDVGTSTNVNASGGSYVAYLFGHEPRGVVQCGSYTNDSANPVMVNLGWEPQYVLAKSTAANAGAWVIADSQRGLGAINPPAGQYTLQANSTGAEGSATNVIYTTPTGFVVVNSINANWNSPETTGTITYIYVAVRAGAP